jgi:hypothetical protein
MGVYSVMLVQCWRSGGRVRAVSAMFWQRIQSQVSCADGFRQNLVSADRSHEQVSTMASDPILFLFARGGLYISGSNGKSKFAGPI